MRNGFPVFKGQMPILPTTINDRGEIDVESQKRLVDYCLANDVAAIGHLGGASEYYKVSASDRELLIRTVVERVNGRVPVFIGTTAVSLRDSIENAKIAHRLGADQLMVCSPIVGVMRPDDLLAYYKEVGLTTPLPIIVQDTGASAGVYTASFIERICDEVPTAGYAKAEGSTFLTKTRELIDRVGDRMQIIGGAGGFHMIQLLRQGVTAFMTGTEAAEIHSKVIHLYLAGEVDEAIHEYYTRLLPYLQIYGMNSLYLLKYMLHKRGIIDNTKILFPDESPVSDALILQELDYIWEYTVNKQ